MFFIGYPVYAFQVDLFGGAWCDDIERMALYLGCPVFILYLTGIHLSAHKWWLPIVFAIPIILIGYGWFVFSSTLIGVFITGNGW